MNQAAFSVRQAFAFCFREFRNHIGLFLYFIFLLLVVHHLSIVTTRMVAFAWQVPISYKKQCSSEGCKTFYGYPTDLLYGHKEIPEDECPAPSSDSRLPYILMHFISLISYIFYALVSLQCMRASLNIYDSGKPNFRGSSPKQMVRLCAGYLLYFVMAFGGLILLIVPGVVWGVRYKFFRFYTAETDHSIRKTFTESWQLTRGSFWKLLGLTCINIVIMSTTMMLLAYIVLRIVIWYTHGGGPIFNQYYNVTFNLFIPTGPLVTLADVYAYRKLQEHQRMQQETAPSLSYEK